MTGTYDDIINLPHHVSSFRPRMSMMNRAAQFSPFAALTGYEAAILETSRLTVERRELDEDTIDALNTKLYMLMDIINERPEVSVTYFKRDDRKAGGGYITVNGALRRIDECEGVIVLVSGKKIRIEEILDIECNLLKV